MKNSEDLRIIEPPSEPEIERLMEDLQSRLPAFTIRRDDHYHLCLTIFQPEQPIAIAVWSGVGWLTHYQPEFPADAYQTIREILGLHPSEVAA